MKVVGWIVLALSLVGCIFVAFMGATTAVGLQEGGGQALSAIAVAIAAAVGVHAGLTLIRQAQSN